MRTRAQRQELSRRRKAAREAEQVEYRRLLNKMKSGEATTLDERSEYRRLRRGRIAAKKLAERIEYRRRRRDRVAARTKSKYWYLTSPDALRIPRSICCNITYICSKHCQFCDRLLDAFEMPDTSVTMAQTETFVKTIVDNVTSLRLLKVAGGEATEHPHFLDIVEILRPAARLARKAWVSTSYYRREVPDLPEPWRYRCDPSDEGKIHHKPFMVSPADIGDTSRNTCRMPWRCGVCWDYQGWSFCSVGTQVARILNRDIFSSEPVEAHLDDTICQHCLWSVSPTPRTAIQEQALSGKIKFPSKTFSKAIHAHRAERKAKLVQIASQG